ncbi:unnamed protein product, partial [Mesorhabditis belari]|uniref:RING-type E3 ubiquitin transferase n=1 Tax=Mesorhabditis belari TaxID=2138241 RepID=A0AAF3J228_9BILA
MENQTYLAEKWEIIRAQSRDDEEVKNLEEQIGKIIHSLCKSNNGLLYASKEYLAKFLYYAMTLLSDVQTIGDEYLHLIETDETMKYTPSTGSKTMFTFWHVLLHLPYLYLKQFGRRSSYYQKIQNPKLKRTLKELLKKSLYAISLSERFHLSIFYIYGNFYNISRRFAGIKYLSSSPQTDPQALKLYRILGFLSIGQCLSSLVFNIWQHAFTNQNQEGDNETIETNEELKLSFQCTVCLEHSPPATSGCGHIFCWNCLQATAKEDSPKCPSCRKDFEPQSVVPLLNL